MSQAALSILVFGIYVVLFGTSLVFVPNTMLKLFKFEKTNEPWIRVAGLVALVLGFYYLIAAQNELTPFFWASIIGRFIFFLGIIFLAVTKKAKSQLIIIGAIDAIGAIWTLIVF